MKVKIKENGFAEQDEDGRITIEYEGNEETILTSKPLPEGIPLTAHLEGFRVKQRIDINPDKFNLNQIIEFILGNQESIMHSLTMISIAVESKNKESWNIGNLMKSHTKTNKILENIQNNPNQIFKENKNET